MPQFDSAGFTEEQAQVLRREFRGLRRQLAVVGGILLLFALLGFGIGLWAVVQRSDDQSARQQQQAEQQQVNAKLSLENCLRFRQGRRQLVKIVKVAIPRHNPGYSAAQQTRINAFYDKIGDALVIPNCNAARQNYQATINAAD